LKKPSLIFFLSIISFLSNAQDLSLSVLSIPKEMKENANAVLRNEQIDITILAIDEMLVSQKRVVTILNKLGDADANIFEHYDNDTKITKLSAIIYDALGNEINKYSKTKFSDISAVDGGTLYSDSRAKYLEYTPTTYPYTLVFESEYKTSTTGFIPWWFPIDGYFISVENSSYTIHNPKLIPWKNKKINFTDFKVIAEELPNKISFSIKNQPALNYENEAIHYREILPKAIVSLIDFSLKGVIGKNENWTDFGLWMNEQLLKGRDELSPATVAKIKSLVSGVENPIERAKLVYKFMQDKTRYISVQVGIGGWEPIAANLVDDVGYGDCKGLTNYTKALLNVADVTSYYTIVYSGEKNDIDKDFSSLQGNHVILNIPNNGKDIWLECTSQIMPFGFLGDFTDDRDVLVITPDGGIIKHTASYKNEQNLQTSKATIQLSEKGNVEATLQIISKGIQYDDKFYIESFTQPELIKHYKSSVWEYLNNVEIKNTSLKNDKQNVEFIENIEVSIQNYATVNETEYLLGVNVFNKNSFVPKKYRDRKLPLKIERGFMDKDEFLFKIPSNYTIEILPAKTEITTKFGHYKISFIKNDDTSFTYFRELIIKEGVFPKEEYEEYYSFRKNVAKLDNIRIAIIKK